MMMRVCMYTDICVCVVSCLHNSAFECVCDGPEISCWGGAVYLWPPVFLRDRVEAQQVVRKLDLSLHSTRDLPFVSELALLKGSRWQYNVRVCVFGSPLLFFFSSACVLVFLCAFVRACVSS